MDHDKESSEVIVTIGVNRVYDRGLSWSDRRLIVLNIGERADIAVAVVWETSWTASNTSSGLFGNHRGSDRKSSGLRTGLFGVGSGIPASPTRPDVSHDLTRCNPDVHPINPEFCGVMIRFMTSCPDNNPMNPE